MSNKIEITVSYKQTSFSHPSILLVGHQLLLHLSEKINSKIRSFSDDYLENFKEMNRIFPVRLIFLKAKLWYAVILCTKYTFTILNFEKNAEFLHKVLLSQ